MQSDLIAGLRSTVVAPLIARSALHGARQLNPLVTIDEREHWIAIHELFAIERHLLGPKVGSVANDRDAVIAALDFLFTGF